jgi:hypothetical protein
MFHKVLASLVVAGLVGLTGCSSSSSNTGGRPEGSGSGNKGGAETFKIETWKKSITVKKGETTDTDFAISRGKDFNDTVTFKIEDKKKGLTFKPAEPQIPGSENKINVKISAAENADIGEHSIHVIATPSKGGGKAEADFTVKVE